MNPRISAIIFTIIFLLTLKSALADPAQNIEGCWDFSDSSGAATIGGFTATVSGAVFMNNASCSGVSASGCFRFDGVDDTILAAPNLSIDGADLNSLFCWI